MTTISREQILRSLILHRYVIRLELKKHNALRAELRNLQRHRRKMENKGVLFPLLDMRIEKLKHECKVLHRAIIDLGEIMFHVLDYWQQAGATLKDLCNLCNMPYDKAVEEIKPDRLDESFGGIMFVHRLDYLHDFSNCGFYRSEVDAPISHSIQEFMLDKMTSDPVAKQASRIAFEKFFPEIAEKMFTIVENAEGETIFLDRDGVEIDPQELL